MVLEVQGERLRVQADDASLVIILEQLAKTSGIAIHLAEPTQERLSIDLTDVELEEGMRRLLKHHNTISSMANLRACPLTSMCSDFGAKLRRDRLFPRWIPP